MFCVRAVERQSRNVVRSAACRMLSWESQALRPFSTFSESNKISHNDIWEGHRYYQNIGKYALCGIFLLTVQYYL